MATAFGLATEQYAGCGVDAEAALRTLAGLQLSLHCWQGDDVAGFEGRGGALDGGLAVTGAYPGKARNATELRADLDAAFAAIPGVHRVNLHASYADHDGPRVDRDELRPEHFARWSAWAKERGLGLDFNPTCFGHPLAASGFTLAHADAGVRQFWIRHAQACRRIAASFGRELGSPSVCNLWIPDGSKDTPADRDAPRLRLLAALDEAFAEPLPAAWMLDAVEPKLFGIGSESYVVGSFEFYLGYAIARQKLLCLDAGHFHPTENVADKLSSALLHVPAVLLHVSRGVRWDSDHVPILDDATLALAREAVAGGHLPRLHLGLDYFDASINRVAAWAIGARCFLKALLIALLEPTALLRQAEDAGDFTTRLAWQEEAKSLPWAAVWDEHCRRCGSPVGAAWLAEVRRYEHTTLALRG